MDPTQPIISTVGKYVTPMVRAGLISLGALLVQRGCYSPADAESLVGEAAAITMGVLTLGGAYLWSVIQKKRANENAEKLVSAAILSLPSATPALVQAKADVVPSSL